ncbi:MAG: hypothetical protein LDL33_15495 [Desulfomonile sp.]|nr:hypothetical protein [Desulfomonile sp.]
MDAALYTLPAAAPRPRRGRPRKKGERLPCPKAIFTHAEEQWEWIGTNLYGQETIVSVHRLEAIRYKAAGNEPLSIVMVRDPGGTYPDTVFFDTDTIASDKETIGRFSHRRSIEITNRETKGLLGSAGPQCRCKKSVTRAPLMAYGSYCLLVVRFVDQFRMGKDLLLRSLVLQETYHLLGHARCRTTQSFHPGNFARARQTPQLAQNHAAALHTPTRRLRKGKTIAVQVIGEYPWQDTNLGKRSQPG